MKNILICTLIFSSLISNGQNILSRKTIDSLISQTESLAEKKVIKSIDKLDAYDTIRGFHTDTATSEYTIDEKSNALLKYSYVLKEDNVNTVYYFHKSRLIAAKLISDNAFPLWSGSIHYFSRPFSYKRNTIISRNVDSQTEDDVREHLKYSGWTIIKYYNKSIKNKNKSK